MKRAIAKLGARPIPGNTKLGYALREWRQELAIADRLARYIGQLGLKCIAKDAEELEDYLAQRYGGTEESSGNGTQNSGNDDDNKPTDADGSEAEDDGQ